MRAADRGNPPLSCEARVTLNVVSERVRVPYFERAQMEIAVMENATIGTHVAQVKADYDGLHIYMHYTGIHCVLHRYAQLQTGCK